MSFPRSPSIHLEIESFGSPQAPAIILVMGLGAPLTRWNVELCEELVARGYRVVRFDNRDCGLSTHLHDAPPPALGQHMKTGAPLVPPYTIAEMAADAVSVLDTLRIDRAHFVGASLGGAIVQHVAASHPQRTLSLTSIMASSGNPALPPPTAAAAMSLFAPLPPEQDEASIVSDALPRFRAVASPAYPTPEERLTAMIGAEYRRGFDPAAVKRQLAALMADGDRRPLLAEIAVPTVVLHGAADPLVPVEHGRDTAACVAGAELRVVAGMGHDFPVALTTVFADAICAAAGRT
jgi:pimeloyl-ACP methyl ester carboxylesterase